MAADNDGGGDVTQEVNVSIEHSEGSPSVILRAVYFLFVGWWASGIWLGVAWLLNLTIVLMPLGIKMINVVPKIVSLKERRIESEVITEGGEVTIRQSSREQYPLAVRAIYFVAIGWWASGIWMFFAWLASITIIGLPLAVWMYSRLPFVVSLYKY